MLADLLIRWTARLFVACYVARILIDARCRQDGQSAERARWIWTIGCAVYVAHVLLAFQQVHHWSHQHAYDQVLLRTREMTGLASGIGLYVNYAFGILWVADVLAWWWWPRWPDQRICYWTVQGIFAFLMIQSTIVFGPWFWTPIGLLILWALIAFRGNAAGGR